MGKKAKDPPPPAPLDLPTPTTEQGKVHQETSATATGAKDKTAEAKDKTTDAKDKTNDGKDKDAEGKNEAADAKGKGDKSKDEETAAKGDNKDKNKGKSSAGDAEKKDKAPAEESWSYYPADATPYMPAPDIGAFAPRQVAPRGGSSYYYPAVPPPPRRRRQRSFLDCLLCRQPPDEDYVGTYTGGNGGPRSRRHLVPVREIGKRPGTPDSQRSWKHHERYFPAFEPTSPNAADESYFPSYESGCPKGKRAEAAAAMHGACAGHAVHVHYPDLPRFAEYSTAGGVRPGTWKPTQWGVEGWTGFGWEGQRLPTAQGHFFSAPMPAGEPLKKDGGGDKKKKK